MNRTKIDPKINKLIGEGLKNRWITVVAHPTLPIRIYNYTRTAEYESKWNAGTMLCRGLILNEDKEIVARPFAKFFSLDQLEKLGTAIPAPPAGDYEIYEKMDGSLGIFYEYGGEYGIASRGSFCGDQATQATAMLNEQYKEYIPKLIALAQNGYTPVFEIIYPENKIVVDYGPARRLVLLAVLEMATGLPSQKRFDDPSIWPDKVTQNAVVINYQPQKHWHLASLRMDFYKLIAERPVPGVMLSHAYSPLQAQLFANKEGFVAVHRASGYRIKLKYPSYVQMHRLIFGLTTKFIWDLVRKNDLKNVVNLLPDYEKSIILSYAQSLEDEFAVQKEQLFWDYNSFEQKYPHASRKEFAKFATKHPYGDLLFLIRDNRFYDDILWNKLKPKVSVRVTGKEPVQ